MIPGSAAAQFFAAGASAGGGAYEISRSLRFNSADSAYLNRTPASAGNRRTWTWSAWVKRTKSSSGATYQSIFTAGIDGNNNSGILFDNSDRLEIWNVVGNVNVTQKITSQVFRDFSSWYHLVVSATSSTLSLYVNGVEVTAWDTNNQPGNEDWSFNAATTHYLARYWDGSSSFRGDFYLADIHFIDGQALTPSSFTEVDATTGQLIPKAYTGSFGTNGFWLKFSDNSAATATTLGKDYSGNSNNWTPNNFSVSTSTTVYTNSFSISGTLFPGSSLANAFDGNIATSATVTNAAQNQTLTFAPSPGIAYTSGVEVYLTPTGDVSVTRYSFNGGADQSFAAGDGWKTVASGSGTLTSLVIKQGAQGNSVGISAIRINGTTILVDNAARNNDSLVDTPSSYGTDDSLGGSVRGNYATWNPLATNSSLTLANGNLQINGAGGSGAYRANSTIAVSTGKWYWEATVTTAGNYSNLGIGQNNLTATDVGVDALSYAWQVETANKANNSSSSSYGTAATTGDVVMFALDLDNNKFFVGKNGTWFASSNPATGASPMYSITAGTYTVSARPYINSGSCQFDFNWGQRSWAYTAPSGFKALCDTNLSAPVVAKPSDYFNAITYSGNSGDGLPTTQDITTGFSPDFVWIKSRSDTNSNVLFDIIRGAGQRLFSNLTNAESTQAASLVSFNSDGFTVGGRNEVNDVGVNYISWTWDAGSSTVTNTQGSITSSVRANASAGFSIATWTLGAANVTVGHGLGVTPSLIICKARTGVSQWIVYHTSTGVGGYLYLSATSAVGTNIANVWSPVNSTVFGVDTGLFPANQDYVSYHFAPVAGYSSFGSYTGNGSADGPFVFCNFRPRWVMVKRSNGTSNWFIYDSARNTFNIVNNFLRADLSNAETAGSIYSFDFLSNGFKLRSSEADINASGGTFIYACFAESPFQYARAR